MPVQFRTVSRFLLCFFFSSRRRHTRSDRDWSSDVCSSDLSVSQDRAAGSAKYNGVAGYFTYNLNREWRVAARAEMFDDKNNFHFNVPVLIVPAGTDVKYNEITATLAYLPNSSVELRGEIRGERANNAVFINSDGTTAKSMQSLGFQGIYKF